MLNCLKALYRSIFIPRRSWTVCQGSIFHKQKLLILIQDINAYCTNTPIQAEPKEAAAVVVAPKGGGNAYPRFSSR